MRLLDTHTGHFVEFYDPSNIRYAILSHTWDPTGEQTYKDIREIQERHPIQTLGTFVVLEQPSNQPKVRQQPSHTVPRLTPSAAIAHPFQAVTGFWNDDRLSQKIRKACEIARFHGYRYLWIDSCCIDKSSSSELSEAINLMYTWYGRASICYAFLADVPPGDIPDSSESAFRRSRWFRRGWTLQELIAPRRLVFLSSDWRTLGSKSSMARLVEHITRIDREVLTNQLSLGKMSVARRISWAAERETTRVEDRAYSLLGIFDLNMPTLYGEGERAFRRLQEEILRRIPDQTLFALNEYNTWFHLPLHADSDLKCCVPRCSSSDWYTYKTWYKQSLFSSSPSSFTHASSVNITPERDYLHLLGLSKIPDPDYSPSPYGIRSSFPIIPIRRCFPSGTLSVAEGDSSWYLVVLSCYSSREFQSLGPHLLARVCRIAPSSSSKVGVMTVGRLRRLSMTTSYIMYYEDFATMFTVTADQLKHLHPHVQIRSVYLPHPGRASPIPFPLLTPPAQDCTLKLALSSYTSAVLRADGSDVEFHEPQRTGALPWTHSLVLRRHDRVLQLNIDQVPLPRPFFLSAAAWFFTAADAEPYRFPLSTCRSPRPHNAALYTFDSYSGPCRITLRKETQGFEGVAIGLELEEASSDSDADPSVSHYLHVDIEDIEYISRSVAERSAAESNVSMVLSCLPDFVPSSRTRLSRMNIEPDPQLH